MFLVKTIKNMLMLPQFICRFKVIPIKIPTGFNNNRNYLKYIQ